jgi:hypothetical protein
VLVGQRRHWLVACQPTADAIGPLYRRALCAKTVQCDLRTGSRLSVSVRAEHGQLPHPAVFIVANDSHVLRTSEFSWNARVGSVCGLAGRHVVWSRMERRPTVHAVVQPDERSAENQSINQVSDQAADRDHLHPRHRERRERRGMPRKLGISLPTPSVEPVINTVVRDSPNGFSISASSRQASVWRLAAGESASPVRAQPVVAR